MAIERQSKVTSQESTEKLVSAHSGRKTQFESRRIERKSKLTAEEREKRHAKDLELVALIQEGKERYFEEQLLLGRTGDEIESDTTLLNPHDKAAIDARNELVTIHDTLVGSVLKRYRGKGMESEDLLQEGRLGLVHAAERFDPTRRVEFSTYAVASIRGRMRNALTRTTEVAYMPRKILDMRATVHEVENVLAQETAGNFSSHDLAAAVAKEVLQKEAIKKELDQDPAPDEIAEKTEALLPDLPFMRRYWGARSLDKPQFEAANDFSKFSLEDTLASDEDAAQIATDNVFMGGALEGDLLEERERRAIIYTYWGKMKQSDIAALPDMKVSQMQISRLLQRGTQKLRDAYFQDDQNPDRKNS
jgi:RNA polymerase sigma-B factor